MLHIGKARARLTDLAEGLRTFQDPEKNVVFNKKGEKHNMTKLQAKVFTAYARQIERIVEEVLTDE